MRIVCISDTHLAHLPPQSISVPDGDVLVHAGDATYRGNEAEIMLFADWFGALPHKHKIFVPGNHDCGFEYNEPAATELLPPCHYLNDSGVEIDGLHFWGSPWQPEFCSWAFNLPRGAALKEHWDKIPDNTDVLVTHTPPMGVLDRVWRWIPGGYPVGSQAKGKPPAGRRIREHVGCADMWQAVQRVRPLLHVFGHIHCDYGVKHHTYKSLDHRMRARTTFVNAAICDERYLPVHAPVVIDL